MAALRIRLPMCVAWALLALASMAVRADPALTLNTRIGAQPLAAALAEFARQSGMQIVYSSALVEGRKSRGVRAGLPLSMACAQLLDGTGLRFVFINDHTVGIFPAAAGTRAPAAFTPHRAGQGSELGMAPEEVIVTAMRREEKQSQVPISMVVWSRDGMEAAGIKGMAQLGALTPGMEFGFRAGIGADVYTDLSIRGVGSRHSAPASIYLDDIPIPPVRATTYLRSFPESFDLDRVEILRGPQSTLLGDHAQGGAVKFYYTRPSLTDYTGLALLEYGTTSAGGPSYELAAAAGGPLVSNLLGFRVSASYRVDGGYVDRVDPFTGAMLVAHANRDLVRTARLALGFAPSDAVHITASYAHQSATYQDSSSFYTALSNPAAGQFISAYFVPQPFTDSYSLAALKLTVMLPFAELNSLTSSFDRLASATFDFTPTPLPDAAHASTWNPALDQRVLTQETRLTSIDPSAAFTWMAGVFAHADHTRHLQGFSTAGVNEPGDGLVVRQSELDGFGQAALKVAKRLTATAGVRVGHTAFDYQTEFPPVIYGRRAGTWSTPRFALSYLADEQHLYYLAVAKGYGSGGVYPDPAGTPAVLRLQPSDTLWSYEAGTKADLGGGRAHLNFSVFRIHWNNGGPEGVTYDELPATPGTLTSTGFDLSLHARVSAHLLAALNMAYADVRFTRTVTLGQTVFVRQGDSPGNVPLSTTASLEETTAFGRDATASLRIEGVYHSRTASQNVSADPATLYCCSIDNPATSVLNLRIAVRWPGFDAAATLNNALNTHPTLGRSNNWPFGSAEIATTLPPRTLRLSGTWHY